MTTSNIYLYDLNAFIVYFNQLRSQILLNYENYEIMNLHNHIFRKVGGGGLHP